MSRYHGGKKRYAESISDEIIKELGERGTSKIICDGDTCTKVLGKKYIGYCEPFVGMASVLNKVKEKIDLKDIPLVYKCGDINASLILMWQEAQKSWQYKGGITFDEFCVLKTDGKHTAEKGFYGHVYGIHGIYFSCFDKEVNNKRLTYSNKKISTMGSSFKDVEFSSGDYTIFSDLKDYIIYCDPPYEKQNIYYDDSHHKIKFNHDEFWEWCVGMSKNNLVIVSEYSIPEHLLGKSNHSCDSQASPAQVSTITIKGNEKLFVFK